MAHWEKNLCSIEILIFSCVLLGALCIQYFHHETPCVLCFLQRIAMTGTAISLLFNVYLVPSRRLYGLAILFAIFGSFVALRQVALHVCPSFDTFGSPFLGLSLYTWSFIVFACSITYNSLILLFWGDEKTHVTPLNALGITAIVLLATATLWNLVAAVQVCGWLACSR